MLNKTLFLHAHLGLLFIPQSVCFALPKPVTDYLTAQEGYNSEMETELSGIGDDVTELNRQIEELKNTPGQTTPEEDAILANLTTKGRELADRLKAINERTPPAQPPTA